MQSATYFAFGTIILSAGSYYFGSYRKGAALTGILRNAAYMALGVALFAAYRGL